VLVSILDDLFREGYVLIVGERRTVDHHRREAHVDAALAQFERIAVVEVQRNRNTLAAVELLGILHGALCHVAQQRLVGVFAGADTCRITGELASTHAEMIACNCSMLLKLNAGMA